METFPLLGGAAGLYIHSVISGLKSAIIFSTSSVAPMLNPPPKIHSLDRVLSRGQVLERTHLGRDGRKIGRGIAEKFIATWLKN